ncbi:MAG: hypothetical protein GWP16_03550 [Nitrospirae bacterium]|nr:hypothetical protein [Nitrospirota bacterium]
MQRQLFLILLLALSLGAGVVAQSTIETPTGQRTLAATMNIHVFPADGQPPEQQSRDEAACYTWAVNNTGVDPFDLSRQAQQESQQADQARQEAQQAGAGSGATGTVVGAAGGALIGQIVSSDPGRGAAWGAGAGLIGGRRARRQAQSRATQQVERQAGQQQRATQEQITGFKNSFAVCLEGKGYMVRF